MSTQGICAPGRELGMTCEEIAAELKISKQSVHATEKRAMAKLRKAYEEAGLRPRNKEPA